MSSMEFYRGSPHSIEEIALTRERLKAIRSGSCCPIDTGADNLERLKREYLPGYAASQSATLSEERF